MTCRSDTSYKRLIIISGLSSEGISAARFDPTVLRVLAHRWQTARRRLELTTGSLGLAEVELFHAVPESVTSDRQQLGGARLIPACLLECVQDHRSFRFLESYTGRDSSLRWPWRLPIRNVLMPQPQAGWLQP